MSHSYASVVATLVWLSACAPAEERGRFIAFSDVTHQAGLSGYTHDNGARGAKYYPEQMGSGTAFIDYDGDGLQDILLLGGGSFETTTEPGYSSVWLFRNMGDGSFTDVTAESGLAAVDAYTIGMAAGDIDNDGDSDLLITNLGVNILLTNNDGVFVESVENGGLGSYDEWSSSAMFFDANNDGWLDIVVGNYADWTIETDKFCPEGGTIKLYCIPADYGGVSSRFYVNDGHGTFAEATVEANLVAPLGKALGIAEWDFDDDGLSDLVVANDGEGDLLYLNTGNGVFVEQGIETGMAFSEHGEARAGMGIDVGVIDSTGAVFLFVGNFSEEMIGVYRQSAGGFFVDQAGASRIGLPSLNTLTFGLFLFDADLDGDLDLFAANGHVYPDRLQYQDKITFRQRSQLFVNVGGGEFREHEALDGTVLRKLLVARGAAYADYDLDGDLDVLIVENDGPAHLWRNDSVSGNFLRVELTGVAANRDAIGAETTVWTDGYRQVRRRRTGSSYLSQSELALVFGLGDNVRIDSLRVEWPSGTSDIVVDLDTNQGIHVKEGAGVVEVITMGVSKE